MRRLLLEVYADKVIVTTIQKLGLALDEGSKRNKQRARSGQPTYKELLETLKDKRIVFIFDECHRSQFGENKVDPEKKKKALEAILTDYNARYLCGQHPPAHDLRRRATQRTHSITRRHPAPLLRDRVHPRKLVRS